MLPVPPSARPSSGSRAPRRVLRLVLAVIAVAMAAGPSAAVAAPVTGTVAFSGYDARPAVPTGLTATVTVNQDASDPLSRLQLALPQGFELGPQMTTAGGGLSLCSPAAFAVHAAGGASCPAESGIGQAQIVTDASTLAGGLYLGAAPAPGELPAIYLEASAAGSSAPDAERIKLAGSMSVDGEGRVSVVFDEIPRPALRELTLWIGTGGQAILATPPACSTYAGFATLTSTLPAATYAAAAAVTIDQDCALPGFDPAIGVSSSNGQAGASSPTVMAVSRPDRTPDLAGARFSLPSGLLAQIGAVPECGLSGGAAAGCPGDALIGSAEITAGVGTGVRTWRGPVFLTSRESGAVAGAHAVIRVQIGDLDLGDLVIPLRIDLRAADAGLDLSFAVPARFRGLALHVRQFRVNADRPGFMLSPSSCGPLAYGAVVTSTGGQSVSRPGAAAYGGCTGLNFAPTLQATLTGELQPLGHPNVTVALNARDGDSNLQSATVTLPRGIAADLANLRNVCPREVFDAAACSASQRVGTATARVSLTPEPIPGDVYLVRLAGQSLPGLGLSFTGRYAQRVISTVSVAPDKRLVVRFEAIPDLPLRRLDMTITGGKAGPIQLASEACQDGSVWDASFTGHGGQASSHTIPAPCAPRDAKRSAVSLSSVSGLRWRISDLGGRTLQSAKLTLPSTFGFVRQRARLKQYQVVQFATGRAKLAVTSKAVILTPQTRTTRSLSVKLRPGSVTRTGRIRVNSKSPLRRVNVKVRLGFTDGTVQNQTVTLRAR